MYNRLFFHNQNHYRISPVYAADQNGTYNEQLPIRDNRAASERNPLMLAMELERLLRRRVFYLNCLVTRLLILQTTS